MTVAIMAEAKRAKAEAVRAEIEAEAEASSHVGSVGERLEIEVGDVRAITSWETSFGLTFLWKITDTVGNVFLWRTTNLVPDGTTKLRGTVKGHDEFNGIKQTVLTRCKMVA